jgi:tetratricopeptide (TPR) repeat protein
VNLRVVSILILLFSVTVRPALAEGDGRELRARQLFAVGKYAEALEIFGDLYAETLHPTYLRNVGRCYQNLGEPDKAISSFSEYLRQAKNLAPAQREQVEGYIREMEELKRKRQDQRAPAQEATRTTPPARLTATDPDSGSTGSSSSLLAAKTPEATASREVDAQRPEAQDSSGRFYTRWWFWTAAAVVVAGGVVGVLALRSDGTATTFGTMDAHPK